MSFILDALKKSESDRQRQAGPALFEVKIAPPKARFPAWAIAVAGLLLVNMAVIGWLLFRHASKSAELATNPPAANVSSNQSPTMQSPAPNGAVMAGSAAQETASGAPRASADGAAGAPLGPSQPTTADRVPAATTGTAPAPSSLPDSPASPTKPSSSAPAALGEPTLARTSREAVAETRTPGAGNPDDDVPATETGPQQDLRGHVRRGTASGLMLYQDVAVAAGSNLPQLRLDLHVYAPKPQDRFALVNMQRVREGDTLPQGVRVESIVPDGVVMSHNGTRFLLPRD